MVCGKGRYTLVKDVDDVENGAYDKPLPCFGCGIGWFSWVESFILFLVLTVMSPVLFTWWYISLYSFLLGFVFPLLWYYATFLYFGNYYRKDPRERAGLAASAITVMTLSFSLSWVLTIWASNEMMMRSRDVAGDGILPLATGDCCFQVVLVALLLTYTHHTLELYIYIYIYVQSWSLPFQRIIEEGLRYMAVHSI